MLLTLIFLFLLISAIPPKWRWAVYGNDDDGFYGDVNWNPLGKKSWWIAVLWWLRNPMHNLCFYVINVPKGFKRISRNNWDVFPPTNYAFNWAYFQSSSWFPFPFFSYQGKLGKFYIGWRERGNWGFKFTGLLSVVIDIGILFLLFPNLIELLPHWALYLWSVIRGGLI